MVKLTKKRIVGGLLGAGALAGAFLLTRGEKPKEVVVRTPVEVAHTRDAGPSNYNEAVKKSAAIKAKYAEGDAVARNVLAKKAAVLEELANTEAAHSNTSDPHHNIPFYFDRIINAIHRANPKLFTADELAHETRGLHPLTQEITLDAFHSINGSWNIPVSTEPLPNTPDYHGVLQGRFNGILTEKNEATRKKMIEKLAREASKQPPMRAILSLYHLRHIIRPGGDTDMGTENFFSGISLEMERLTHAAETNPNAKYLWNTVLNDE